MRAAEIGRRLGIPAATVRRYAPSWESRKDEVISELQELRSSGVSISQIAKDYGMSRNTVARHTVEGYPDDKHYPEDLPDLGEDDFKWTPEELEDATREARRLLFHVAEETS